MELWLVYAVGAAVFAALTTVLAKIGIENVDSHLATAIRTAVVIVFAWIMVFMARSYGYIWHIDGTTWVFLLLSGLATGGSWLCFFKAIKLGSVNKVVPIDKSSTILTMILAFIFLREPAGWVTVVGMVFMGIGTWLMLELKRDGSQLVSDTNQLNHATKPIFYAVLAAVFASLVAIFGRLGVAYMDAYLWTAIRTMVVLPLSLLMVFFTGAQKSVKTIACKSWIFLILSGVATGVSWLFFYHALQIGQASHVVPIDKLSIVITMGFARLFLGERFTRRSIVGLTLLTMGTLAPIVMDIYT